MAKQLTKAEWDKFLADDGFWEGLYYDEALFEIGGEEVDDVTPEIEDSTNIKLKAGIVIEEDSMEVKGTLEGLFQKWRKQQNMRSIVVEVPLTVTNQELKKLLKSVGGKVV